MKHPTNIKKIILEPLYSIGDQVGFYRVAKRPKFGDGTNYYVGFVVDIEQKDGRVDYCVRYITDGNTNFITVCENDLRSDGRAGKVIYDYLPVLWYGRKTTYMQIRS